MTVTNHAIPRDAMPSPVRSRSAMDQDAKRRRWYRGAHRVAIWSCKLTVRLMVPEIIGRLAAEAQAARHSQRVRNITVIARQTIPPPQARSTLPVRPRPWATSTEITAPLPRCVTRKLSTINARGTRD